MLIYARKSTIGILDTLLNSRDEGETEGITSPINNMIYVVKI